MADPGFKNPLDLPLYLAYLAFLRENTGPWTTLSQCLYQYSCNNSIPKLIESIHGYFDCIEKEIPTKEDDICKYNVNNSNYWNILLDTQHNIIHTLNDKSLLWVYEHNQIIDAFNTW